MSLSQTFKIYFYKGDTHTAAFTVLDGAGSPIDLTGASGSLVVANSGGSTVATVSGTVPTGTDGLIKYKFVPSDTSGLSVGNYTYTAKVTLADTSVYTICKDSLVLK